MIFWFLQVIQEAAAFHDKGRVFYSNIENDNPLDCIISKVNIVKREPAVCSTLITSSFLLVFSMFCFRI